MKLCRTPYTSVNRLNRYVRERTDGEVFRAPESVLDWAESLPEPPDEWNEITSGFNNVFTLCEQPTDPLPRPSLPTHRQEMCFKNELHEMTPIATDLLPQFFDTPDEMVVTEMPYGNRYRTDVVVCTIDWDAVSRRAQLIGGLQPLTDEWRYLKSYRWWRNRDEAFTRSEFIEETGYAESSAPGIFDWLFDNGFLTGRENGYCQPKPLPGIIESAHAIELKQQDWETALEQAERANRPSDYTEKYGYADYRWVCLDAGALGKADEHLDAFRDAGVGLLALTETAVVQITPAEQASYPDESLDRVHLNEKCITRLPKDGKYHAQTTTDDEPDSDLPDEQTGLKTYT